MNTLNRIARTIGFINLIKQEGPPAASDIFMAASIIPGFCFNNPHIRFEPWDLFGPGLSKDKRIN